MPACAKYHAMEDTSTAQKVAVDSLPPPNNKRLAWAEESSSPKRRCSNTSGVPAWPMFEGVTSRGMASVSFFLHDDAVSSAPMEKSIKLWIKPLTDPAQRASKFGIKLSAQLFAANDNIAAMAEIEDITCSTLMAHTLPYQLFAVFSSFTFTHVFAASLMLAASAANCVVACRVLNVQDAKLAFCAGVFELRKAPTAAMVLSAFSRPFLWSCHCAGALPKARCTSARASVALSCPMTMS
mmetsp:Transcript_80539/g.158069  ORF Transcript_80539/g.158069 Transcript_80539/m.158069 type:complete len:239 (+) Transcript_80539:644-1360(+)